MEYDEFYAPVRSQLKEKKGVVVLSHEMCLVKPRGACSFFLLASVHPVIKLDGGCCQTKSAKRFGKL